MRGGSLHGTRYDLRNASMLDLISTAYDVDGDKVLGGPSWLEMDRFDVLAIAPSKTPKEALHQMLQSLLRDRFNLVVHPETKPLPAYALTLGKHPTLKEADGSGESGCKQNVMPVGPPPTPTDGFVTIRSVAFSFSCHNTTMESFIDELPIPQRPGEISRHVVDKTGLKGSWNFDFKFTMEGGFNISDLAPLSDALDKQLGLKLESAMEPAQIVEVQSVNQNPTPNSPAEMKMFPPLPTQFDVAEVKPYQDDGNGPQQIRIGDGVVVFRGRGGPPPLQNGRVTLTGYTLKNLMLMAWDLPNNDSVAGAPKWTDTDKYTIVAKVPEGPVADAFTDLDSVKPLLRTLLLSYFKMTVHNEERPLPGYVLSAVKPKLKKADPAGRTKWINGPGPDGKDPRNGNPALGRLVTCQNMTMAQFSELLPGIAGGYLRGMTVVNQTGLDDAFDFTFYFSPIGNINGAGPRAAGRMGDAATVGDASEPSAGMSLYGAISKLLGLKLEMQKRPMPVMVIDHVEAPGMN